MAELRMYAFEEGSALMTFATLPDLVIEAIHITRARLPTITVKELDDEINVVSRKEVRAMEAPEFQNRLQLYTETGRASPSITLGSIRR